MMEKLKANLGKSLQLEEFQTITKLVETFLQVESIHEAMTSQEPTFEQVQTELVRREVEEPFMTFEEFLAQSIANQSP